MYWITLNKILIIISGAQKIDLLVISEQENESNQRGGKVKIKNATSLQKQFITKSSNNPMSYIT